MLKVKSTIDSSRTQIFISIFCSYMMHIFYSENRHITFLFSTGHISPYGCIEVLTYSFDMNQNSLSVICLDLLFDGRWLA